jgi:TPR repeat protein
MPLMKIVMTAFALTLALPALAEEDPAQFGITNPDEMTWQRFAERADEGETGMVLCATGYMMTKSGDHATARKLFENCANAGYTGAMTWMSQLDNNGLGAEYDPEKSAEWDRRAAEAGDPVGQFNHGVNMLRGHGIARDEARGRALVDQAAEAGVDAAQRLRGAGYDLDEITPDADDWKYGPLF